VAVPVRCRSVDIIAKVVIARVQAPLQSGRWVPAQLAILVGLGAAHIIAQIGCPWLNREIKSPRSILVTTRARTYSLYLDLWLLIAHLKLLLDSWIPGQHSTFRASNTGKASMAARDMPPLDEPILGR
jgi:hypothetical protein